MNKRLLLIDKAYNEVETLALELRQIRWSLQIVDEKCEKIKKALTELERLNND